MTLSLGPARSVTRSAVMILVRLAMGSRWNGLYAPSTRPLSTSKSRAACGGLAKLSGEASPPVMRILGVGDRCSSGEGSAELLRASAALAASGRAPPPPLDPRSRTSPKYALAPAAARTSTRPKNTTLALTRRRLRPPVSTLPVPGRRGEGSEHAETKHGQDHERHDHKYVHAVLDRHGDREHAEQADEHESCPQGDAP